jgi:thiamine-phosphate pyrophosphorylase
LILPDPPVLLITDRRMAARPLPDVVEAALRGGCRWVLLREPDLARDDLIALGREILARCVRAGAMLSVSADLEASAAIGAGGLHLPQRLASKNLVKDARARLGDGALIGISCHSQAEAVAAERAGADYITLSPVFLTESKPGYGPALGPAGFRAVAAPLGIPALGLAGITAENASSVRGAGAAGIAVMGNVMRAGDAAQAMADIIDAWRI